MAGTAAGYAMEGGSPPSGYADIESFARISSGSDNIANDRHTS